jgi:GNAT superfamily N-acetyltransferase
MDARIRLARPEDGPGVVAIVRAIYDEYGLTWDPYTYHADLYDLKGHYLDCGHSFYVAECYVPGGPQPMKVVGTIAARFFEPVPGQPDACVEYDARVRVGGADCALDRLYVHSEFRRKGVGTGLCNSVVEEARARGRRLVEIWSDKRFEDAHRLYEKLGAKVVGERICHDPDHSPEWGLALHLKRDDDWDED